MLFFSDLSDFIRQKYPSKKTNGNKFDSSPHLDNIICQGEIARRNIAKKPVSLSNDSFPTSKINGKHRIPVISMGSLTANELNPNTAINGMRR